MKIIEQFIQSKTITSKDCEDDIFVNDNFIAVIDGATSVSAKTWDGKKSGKIALELISTKLSELDANIGAPEALKKLNTAIADWYKEQGVYDYMHSDPSQRCSASIALYSKAKNQIWFVGDCQALVDGELLTYNKYINTILSNARAIYIESELLEGKSVRELQEHDSGREFIYPLLKKQKLFQNSKKESEFKYEALDGFFKDTHTATIFNIPQNTKEVVLASDGYPVLASTLKESENLLKKILEEDPLLYKKYKSTKGLRTHNRSYDDRSYIRFSV